MMNTTPWRKSSYSAPNNACVELAVTTDSTGVRDSKRPGTAALWFPTTAFADLLSQLK